MAKLNKKSQVAVFVIVGIIILLSGLAIYVIQRSGVDELEQEVLEEPSLAGQTELSSFVNDCLQDNTLQGLELLGLQGGYITLPLNAQTLQVIDVNNKQISDGKVIVNEDKLANDVPYWLTTNQIGIPSLSFMESELEFYVSNELSQCVNDFVDFKEEGFEVEYGDISVSVEMEKAVVVSVDFPVTLSKVDLTLEENSFVYSVPINMKEIHETALDLAVLEDFHTYLEDHTMNLISLYSAIDSESLPPISQSTTNFDCSFVTWDKDSVEQNLKNIMHVNMPHLKVEGTQYSLPSSTSQFSGVYESFVYDLLGQPKPTLKVDFIYDRSWDFLQYDVQPSSGSLLQPQKVQAGDARILPMICVFKYPFRYTMQFPVLIKVTDTLSANIDPDANVYFENEGFTFQFPIVGYLCGNQNRACKTGIVPTADTISFEGVDRSLFCDSEQRISNDIVIKTFDSTDSSVLGNVDVNYICGSSENNCFIGRTNSNGVMQAKFPLCVNGQLLFSKSDYSSLSSDFTTKDIPISQFSYFLEPQQSFSVEVKKVYLPEYMKNYHETGLLSLGTALVDLENLESVNIVSDPNLFYIYPDPGNRDIKLDVDSYAVDLQLNTLSSIAEKVVGDITIPKFIGNYLSGSLSTSFDVVKEDLAKSKITFFVFTDYLLDELVSADRDLVDDPILKEDGTLSAELLYSCGDVGSCDFDNCDFVRSDGTATLDFADDDSICQKAFTVTITKEQYNQFMKPILS